MATASDSNVLHGGGAPKLSCRSSTTNATLLGLSRYLQAIFLIAGTTVGGGFLALPATVVVPLGGFLPSAVALVIVWGYLLVCSWMLCDGILMASAQTETNDNSIGIPKTAQAALGPKGSCVATLLLVTITVATLVSQLSRAGSLFASQLSGASSLHGSSLVPYRIGCTLAALIGAAITYKGASKTINENQPAANFSNTTSFADKFNAVLTAVFLCSAVLLFRAVSKGADWSACWSMTGTLNMSSLLPKVLEASPIMLQLLVYGEILPNVCRMLEFDRRSIRRAVFAGSMIPLILLTGWAALGVALIPNGRSSSIVGKIKDPVDIMLATGALVVQRRLLTLAISAIGTTIIGSLLALQSAYDDWKTMLPRRESLLQQSWVRAFSILTPSLIISLSSPSIFLQAIDFAGSYPVLLLYGVLPPLMVQQLGERRKTIPKLYTTIGVLSATLIGVNVIADGRWLLQKLFTFGSR